MERIDVPVLIVGGGVTGLACSMILSRLGVDSLLVTYYPGTSPHPKAHIINQRTMEIFEELGIAQAVYEVSTPPEQMKYAGWYAGLKNGRSPWHGREIGKVEAWGCGWSDPDYMAASPCRHANYPQMYLEPILKEHAERLSPGRLRYFHELLDFEQDADYVLARVRNRENGEIFEVRSRFLLGADGGKTVGRQMGIELRSQGPQMRMSSVHFAADLSPWSDGPDVQTRFLINPDFGGSWASGVLMPEGPTQWGKYSEEWVYHARYTLSDTDPMDHAHVLQRMKDVFGIADFDPRIIHISEWRMGGFLADRYGKGRVWLLGDSCRQHPPTGGLGLNGGVQDAYNLCWKLKLVLQGAAPLSLLETYEQERRPVAQRHVELALANAAHHFLIDRALGLDDKDSPQQNWDRLKRLWDGRSDSETLRLAVSQAVARQRIGFRHLNAELGYTYAQGALAPDPKPALPELDPVLIYQPQTRAGHPVPHAWLDRLDQRHAVGALVQDGHFVLLIDEQGESWGRAAQQLAADRGLPLRVLRVGLNAGDYLDTRGVWLRQRGVGPDGAVLLRPDRFVAWTARQGSENALAALSSVFDQILKTAGTAFPSSGPDRRTAAQTLQTM